MADASITEFVTLVKDDLDRTDMDASIKSALIRNIRFYQSKRFFFNTNVPTDFNVLANSNEIDTDDDFVYTASTNKSMPVYFSVDKVSEIVSGQVNRDLLERQYTDIDPDSVANTGVPCYYARLPEKIILDKYNASAATYRVKGHKRIDAPANDTDDNDWLLFAGDLLRAKVMSDIYAYKLHNAEKALMCMELAKFHMESLITETARMQGTGKLTPTQF